MRRLTLGWTILVSVACAMRGRSSEIKRVLGSISGWMKNFAPKNYREERGRAHLPNLEVIRVEFKSLLERRSRVDQTSELIASGSGRWACPRSSKRACLR